ncbi:hypothetical protein NDU88_000740 [Pleurodeles waltl]|uniref:Uncharacterized protein n=1 Tax=Pleurodeles waltl TaxID=8319 RepID=A0AAV7S828_PLEWA|nr:hypothetical protein NDU88_000740 [Pleurodeles waltl]
MALECSVMRSSALKLGLVLLGATALLPSTLWSEGGAGQIACQADSSVFSSIVLLASFFISWLPELAWAQRPAHVWVCCREVRLVRSRLEIILFCWKRSFQRRVPAIDRVLKEPTLGMCTLAWSIPRG